MYKTVLPTISLLFLGAGIAVSPLAAAGDPAGVPNFHRVNEQILRGAQPTEEGFRNLAHLGVKTVIDLREADSLSLQERKMVEAAGMRFVNIPMRGMHTPTDEQIVKVLALFNDSQAGPVFVHCKRGADRTGTVVACYRISHDGWQNHKALAEARSLGMSWFEKALQSYVLGYKAGETVQAAAPSITPTAAPALLAP